MTVTNKEMKALVVWTDVSRHDSILKELLQCTILIWKRKLRSNRKIWLDNIKDCTHLSIDDLFMHPQRPSRSRDGGWSNAIQLFYLLLCSGVCATFAYYTYSQVNTAPLSVYCHFTSTYKFKRAFFRHDRRTAPKFGRHVWIETKLALTKKN